LTAEGLEWAIQCDGLAISWKGENVPSSPFESMQFDFVARRDGKGWPDP
jgi:hypothetical protein